MGKMQFIAAAVVAGAVLVTSCTAERSKLKVGDVSASKHNVDIDAADKVTVNVSPEASVMFTANAGDLQAGAEGALRRAAPPASNAADASTSVFIHGKAGSFPSTARTLEVALTTTLPSTETITTTVSDKVDDSGDAGLATGAYWGLGVGPFAIGSGLAAGAGAAATAAPGIILPLAVVGIGCLACGGVGFGVSYLLDSSLQAGGERRAAEVLANAFDAHGEKLRGRVARTEIPPPAAVPPLASNTTGRAKESPPMPKEEKAVTWFYAVNDEKRGPVPTAELVKLVAAQKVAAGSLVWKSGMSDWQPFDKVAELRRALEEARRPMVSGEWYYSANGAERVGPVDGAAFGVLIDKGTVTSETLVWKKGMAEWIPAGRVDELKPRLSSRPKVTGSN